MLKTAAFVLPSPGFAFHSPLVQHTEDLTCDQCLHILQEHYPICYKHKKGEWNLEAIRWKNEKWYSRHFRGSNQGYIKGCIKMTFQLWINLLLYIPGSDYPDKTWRRHSKQNWSLQNSWGPEILSWVSFLLEGSVIFSMPCNKSTQSVAMAEKRANLHTFHKEENLII